MPSERLLLIGLCAVLVLAPLPFGAVQPVAAGVLAAGCFVVGAVWVASRARRGVPLLPARDPLLAAGAALLLVGIVQLVPLPPTVLARVSPRALEMRARYEPAGTRDTADARSTAPARPRPASLYPWATGQALLRLAAFLAIALATADLASSQRGRRWITAALVGSGGFQAVYGLVEYLSGRQHIFGYAKRFYTDVATGTFINRNHYAGFLAMTLPIALALAGEAWSRRSRPAPAGAPGDQFSGRHAFRAACWLLAALVMAVALVCSRSRMGILSLLLAFATLGIALAWSGRGRGFVGLAFVLIVTTALVFSQGGAATPVLERFTTLLDDLRGHYGRWQIWTQAASVWSAFPLIGVGLGTFPHVFPAFRTGGAGVFLSHAHNDVLEFAVEMGVIGCAVGLFAAVFLIWRWRDRVPARPGDDFVVPGAMTGLLAIGFHSLGDFNLSIPANGLIVAALLGLTGASLRVAAPVLLAARPPGRSRPGAAAAVVAVLVLFAGAAVSTARGGPDQRIREAAGMARASLEDLQALAQADAGAAAPAAGADLVSRRLGEAVGRVEAGLADHPLSGKGHAVRGRLLLAKCAAAQMAGREAGACVGEAVGALRSALELSPMSAATHAQVAALLVPLWPVVQESERAEVKALIDRAVALNPRNEDLRMAWRLSLGPGSAP